MQITHTIRDLKILIPVVGIVGFFFIFVLYPHISQAQESSQTNQRQSTTEIAVQDQLRRVIQSIETKSMAIDYLQKALQEQSKKRLFTATEIKILRIANQNFQAHSAKLKQHQQEYLDYLQTMKSSQGIDQFKIEKFKKNIYKSQQDAYYAFWETYNLMQ